MGFGKLSHIQGNPLGFFNIQSIAKFQKIEGGPFEGESLQCRKKGGPLSRAWYCMLRGKTKNVFGSVR